MGVRLLSVPAKAPSIFVSASVNKNAGINDPNRPESAM
jgi:hypothetical protein